VTAQVSRPVSNPRLSVVVPAFNNGAFIAATLRSILNQTFRDFELVVSDHGSQDDTLDVVTGFASDERLRVLRTEPGGGAQRNWNRVTAAARGTYLKLVCGDDVLHPACLERQLAEIQDRPQVTLVASRRDVIDAHGAPLLQRRGLPGLQGEVPGDAAIRATVRSGVNIFGEPACVLMRTQDVLAVGGWSTTAQYLIDLDLYVRLLRQGDLFALPQSLAAFRVSASQWSVALAAEQARQTRAFVRDVRATSPNGVSQWDAVCGITRAYAAAAGRRAAYAWWSSRLHP
jgi:glycosyltransferase involved in cell wall biosynthesis